MSNLTEEQANKVLDKLNKIWRRPCPCCGGTHGFEFDPTPIDWVSMNDVIKVIDEHANSIPTLPVIVGSCKDCGYVVSFDLKKILD